MIEDISVISPNTRGYVNPLKLGVTIHLWYRLHSV